MTIVHFINAAGRNNSADLTSEQIERLRDLKGYQILKKVKVHDFSESKCEACE